MDNNVVARNPVDWGGDSVLVASLKGVDDTEDLCGVAASGGRVRENEADSLLGVNDEDRADRKRNTLRINVRSVLVIQPPAVSARPIVKWYNGALLTCHRDTQSFAACRQ